MITLKGASGLGDSVYIYPIAKHYLDNGEDVHVLTNYPELFKPLNVTASPHTKQEWGSPVKKISYCSRKYDTSTTQWEDVLLAAGLEKEKITLDIEWETINIPLIDLIKKRAKGKPYVCVASPYKPFGREDEFGKELTLDYKKYDLLLEMYKEAGYFIVQTGKEDSIYNLENVDLTLNRKTSASDLLDIVFNAQGCIFPVGHMLPICEALNKPGLCVFSDNGLNCENRFISSITPQKVIHKKKLIDVRIDKDI